MSQFDRDLVRCLAAAGVDAAALAACVGHTAAARAEATNREGLEAQIACPLEAYGPDEIESLALGHRPRGEQP